MDARVAEVDPKLDVVVVVHVVRREGFDASVREST